MTASDPDVRVSVYADATRNQCLVAVLKRERTPTRVKLSLNLPALGLPDTPIKSCVDVISDSPATLVGGATIEVDIRGWDFRLLRVIL